jgi:hypothetical protein
MENTLYQSILGVNSVIPHLDPKCEELTRNGYEMIPHSFEFSQQT